MKRNQLKSIIMIVLVIILSACNAPQSEPEISHTTYVGDWTFELQVGEEETWKIDVTLQDNDICNIIFTETEDGITENHSYEGNYRIAQNLLEAFFSKTHL